jgi:hypothetical protein
MTSLYGTVTLGRLPALFEQFEAKQSDGGSISLTVQASGVEGTLSNAQVERLKDDLLGITGKVIPVPTVGGADQVERLQRHRGNLARSRHRPLRVHRRHGRAERGEPHR